MCVHGFLLFISRFRSIAHHYIYYFSMKLLFQVLLVLSFLLDMVSTEYAIPDLQNESNALVSLFHLNINDLWVLSFFQAIINLLLIHYFFNFVKKSFDNYAFIIYKNKPSLFLFDFETWRKIFVNGFLFFSFSLPFANIYFKFFAIIRNVIYGINRWKTFFCHPEIQSFVDQCHFYIQKNYDELAWIIFQNQFIPPIYIVLLFWFVKKRYIKFIFSSKFI